MIATLPYILAAVAAAGDPSQLAVENCQIGEIYAFNKAECEIELRNEGDKAVRVFDAKAAREGDSVEPVALNVPPHAHAYLKAKIDSANGVAMTPHLIRFRTDERGHEDRSAAAVAFVTTVLDDPRPQLDFGVVKLNGEAARKSVSLSSHDVAGFKITKIIEAPAWLDASIGAEGNSISAAVKPDAGWGLHDDFLKIALNTPQQPQAWIEVKADVHGEVVPGANPLDMSLMRIGSAHEFHIPLRSRSGKPFRVGKIELEGLHGTTQLDSCEKPGGGCQMVVLKAEDQQPGPIKGHIWIELPEFHQRLNLVVGGLLVPKDLKIKSLEEALARTRGTSEGQSQTASVDLQHAVKEAVSNAAATATPPTGNGPLLKWTIANGISIHGFQIFRAENENGPFVLLNAKTIPSTAQTQDSIGYQWRDNTAATGKTYWYYIGIVYNDGHKQQLTGPQKVTAK